MSSAKQQGRADAAKGWGNYNPPSRAGVFASDKEHEKATTRREEYREGYYDKRRELEKKR